MRCTLSSSCPPPTNNENEYEHEEEDDQGRATSSETTFICRRTPSGWRSTPCKSALDPRGDFG